MADRYACEHGRKSLEARAEEPASTDGRTSGQNEESSTPASPKPNCLKK